MKDLEAQKTPASAGLTIQTRTEKHATACQIKDCTISLDEMTKVCGTDIKMGCKKTHIGCRDHFCSKHRAVDRKVEIPDTICINCKDDYMAAKKTANCRYIIMIAIIVAIVSGVLLTGLIVSTS